MLGWRVKTHLGGVQKIVESSKASEKIQYTEYVYENCDTNDMLEVLFRVRALYSFPIFLIFTFLFPSCCPWGCGGGGRAERNVSTITTPLYIRFYEDATPTTRWCDDGFLKMKRNFSRSEEIFIRTSKKLITRHEGETINQLRLLTGNKYRFGNMRRMYDEKTDGIILRGRLRRAFLF